VDVDCDVTLEPQHSPSLGGLPGPAGQGLNPPAPLGSVQVRFLPRARLELLDAVAERCHPVAVFDHRDLILAVYDVPERCAGLDRAEQVVTASDVRWMQMIRQDATFPEECSGVLGIRDHRRKATVICLDELGPLVVRTRVGTTLMLENNRTLPLASPCQPRTPCHANLGRPVGTESLVETRCKENLRSPLARPVVRPLAGVGTTGHGDLPHTAGTIAVRCSCRAGSLVHDAVDSSVISPPLSPATSRR
jgi:hypothetical protein